MVSQTIVSQNIVFYTDVGEASSSEVAVSFENHPFEARIESSAEAVASRKGSAVIRNVHPPAIHVERNRQGNLKWT